VVRFTRRLSWYLLKKELGVPHSRYGRFKEKLLAPAGNQNPDVELSQLIVNQCYLKYVHMYILIF